MCYGAHFSVIFLVTDDSGWIVLELTRLICGFTPIGVALTRDFLLHAPVHGVHPVLFASGLHLHGDIVAAGVDDWVLEHLNIEHSTMPGPSGALSLM